MMQVPHFYDTSHGVAVYNSTVNQMARNVLLGLGGTGEWWPKQRRTKLNVWQRLALEKKTTRCQRSAGAQALPDQSLCTNANATKDLLGPDRKTVDSLSTDEKQTADKTMSTDADQTSAAVNAMCTNIHCKDKRAAKTQCMKCLRVFYCTRQCMRKDWKASHSKVCSHLKAKADAALSTNALEAKTPLVLGVVVASNCAACGTAATLRCTKCKTAMYCSQKCQSTHWKNGHKQACAKQVTESGATAGAPAASTAGATPKVTSK